MFTDDLSSVSYAELAANRNWQVQYRLLTQWGRLIKPKSELRVDEYLIKGCETPAWLAHRVEGEAHFFAFDSDSRVINGLAALLLAHLNAKTLDELRTVDFFALLAAVGLEKHITPSRNNGLMAIVTRALLYAGCLP